MNIHDAASIRAAKLPPARKVDTSGGALPAARRLMTHLSDWRKGVCWGTSDASMIFWMRRPEGPATVKFGKDIRIAIRLKSGGMVARWEQKDYM